jgi:hypothetical protein
MSDALRSKVIRLAHQNPALRPHLLPLLKTAAATFRVKEVKVSRKGVFVESQVEIPTSEVPATGDISKALTKKYGDDLVLTAAREVESDDLEAAGYEWAVDSTKGSKTVFRVTYLLGVA